MNGLKFRCCFCNKGIESSKTNPAEINVLINLDKSKDQQYNQNFYCHVECFREKIHEAMRMHFHLHNILDD
jgi:formiminotetrahydrofolate cyclodeaminase